MDLKLKHQSASLLKVKPFKNSVGSSCPLEFTGFATSELPQSFED